MWFNKILWWFSCAFGVISEVLHCYFIQDGLWRTLQLENCAVLKLAGALQRKTIRGTIRALWRRQLGCHITVVGSWQCTWALPLVNGSAWRWVFFNLSPAGASLIGVGAHCPKRLIPCRMDTSTVIVSKASSKVALSAFLCMQYFFFIFRDKFPHNVW